MPLRARTASPLRKSLEWPFLLALPGAIPILLGIGCALLKSGLRSRDGYVGSERCIACHGKLHPQTVAAWRASRHHVTMQPVRGRAGDASFVIGRQDRRHVQVRRDMQILPSGGWQDDEVPAPHDAIAAEGCRVDAADHCLGCHTTGYFVARREFAEPGVGCEACHGPGKKHADSRGARIEIVDPAMLSRPRQNMVCGQCHSLGKDPSGAHPFPVMREGGAVAPFQPGQDLALGFVDAKPKLERKGWEYSLFVRAVEEYARQLCTDCHDPHGRAGNPSMLKDPTNETCLRCHGLGRARLRFENHGAVGNVTSKLCWSCHRNAHSH